MNSVNEIYKKALRFYLGDYILKQINNKKEECFSKKLIKKKLTVFVLDVKPFKNIDTSLPRDFFLNILDIFHETMAQPIINNDGFIESIRGNSISSLFGLNKIENSAIDACRSALECVKKTKDINDKISKKDFIKIGIGISTGIVLLGNIGSQYRYTFTCLGDTVNFASRLQRLNNNLNTNIIISESTKNLLNKDFQIGKMHNICIKGQEDLKNIYEIY